jgi:NADH oxidase (H2O2-forming)
MARKTDRNASITIVHNEPIPEYSRCGLPYTVSGKIPELENVIIHPTSFYVGSLVGADLRLAATATKIDPKAKSVQIQDASKHSTTLSYDALVLATGAHPSLPPIKGLDAPHVHRLHTFDDARSLQAAARKAKTVVVIGAGLVGLEAAEALHILGLKVTVVEFLESVLPAMIDDDMGRLVQERMENEGIVVMLGTAAKEVTKTHVAIANRASGKEEVVPADLVVVATGVRANSTLAADAGTKLGRQGGILVDDHMQTTLPDIYAAGDCAEHRDFVTGQTLVSGLGSVALRQGEIAGVNAAGGQAQLPGMVLARTTRLFDLEIAAVGPTRVTAERANLPLLISKFEGSTTAEYYPTDTLVTIKLLAHKESGKLLGGQVIGPCAHQRANVLSAALAAGMTVRQLADLETCYAPPVAPIREPFTMAAQVLALRQAAMRKKS